jgi:hypothetical protein
MRSSPSLSTFRKLATQGRRGLMRVAGTITRVVRKRLVADYQFPNSNSRGMSPRFPPLQRNARMRAPSVVAAS